MRALLLAPVLLAVLLPMASAAVVQGTLYDYAFNPVQGIVTVNSTPAQTVVAANGSYEFSVEPGVYLLSAVSRQNDTATQVLEVRSEGNYRLDMVLFEEFDLPQEGFTDLDGDGLPDLGEDVDPQEGAQFPWLLALLAVAAVGFAAYYLLTRRPPEAKTAAAEPALELEAAPSPAAELEDEKEVMAVLDSEGGLISQKDLRKKLPHWSEARVSLVLTSLEAAGKVKKIKKGRGNVIRRP